MGDKSAVLSDIDWFRKMHVHCRALDTVCYNLITWLSLIRLLWTGMDVETRLGFGWTPLMCAVSEANYDLAKLLLDRGANASFSKGKPGSWSSNMDLYFVHHVGKIRHHISEKMKQTAQTNYLHSAVQQAWGWGGDSAWHLLSVLLFLLWLIIIILVSADFQIHLYIASIHLPTNEQIILSHKCPSPNGTEQSNTAKYILILWASWLNKRPDCVS